MEGRGCHDVLQLVKKVQKGVYGDVSHVLAHMSRLSAHDQLIAAHEVVSALVSHSEPCADAARRLASSLALPSPKHHYEVLMNVMHLCVSSRARFCALDVITTSLVELLNTQQQQHHSDEHGHGLTLGPLQWDRTWRFVLSCVSSSCASKAHLVMLSCLRFLNTCSSGKGVSWCSRVITALSRLPGARPPHSLYSCGRSCALLLRYWSRKGFHSHVLSTALRMSTISSAHHTLFVSSLSRSLRQCAPGRPIRPWHCAVTHVHVSDANHLIRVVVLLCIHRLQSASPSPVLSLFCCCSRAFPSLTLSHMCSSPSRSIAHRISSLISLFSFSIRMFDYDDHFTHCDECEQHVLAKGDKGDESRDGDDVQCEDVVDDNDDHVHNDEEEEEEDEDVQVDDVHDEDVLIAKTLVLDVSRDDESHDEDDDDNIHVNVSSVHVDSMGIRALLLWLSQCSEDVLSTRLLINSALISHECANAVWTLLRKWTSSHDVSDTRTRVCVHFVAHCGLWGTVTHLQSSAITFISQLLSREDVSRRSFRHKFTRIMYSFVSDCVQHIQHQRLRRQHSCDHVNEWMCFKGAHVRLLRPFSALLCALSRESAFEHLTRIQCDHVSTHSMDKWLLIRSHPHHSTAVALIGSFVRLFTEYAFDTLNTCFAVVETRSQHSLHVFCAFESVREDALLSVCEEDEQQQQVKSHWSVDNHVWFLLRLLRIFSHFMTNDGELNQLLNSISNGLLLQLCFPRLQCASVHQIVTLLKAQSTTSAESRDITEAQRMSSAHVRALFTPFYAFIVDEMHSRKLQWSPFVLTAVQRAHEEPLTDHLLYSAIEQMLCTNWLSGIRCCEGNGALPDCAVVKGLHMRHPLRTCVERVTSHCSAINGSIRSACSACPSPHHTQSLVHMLQQMPLQPNDDWWFFTSFVCIHFTHSLRNGVLLSADDVRLMMRFSFRVICKWLNTHINTSHTSNDEFSFAETRESAVAVKRGNGSSTCVSCALEVLQSASNVLSSDTCELDMNAIASSDAVSYAVDAEDAQCVRLAHLWCSVVLQLMRIGCDWRSAVHACRFRLIHCNCSTHSQQHVKRQCHMFTSTAQYILCHWQLNVSLTRQLARVMLSFDDVVVDQDVDVQSVAQCAVVRLLRMCFTAPVTSQPHLPFAVRSHVCAVAIRHVSSVRALCAQVCARSRGDKWFVVKALASAALAGPLHDVSWLTVALCGRLIRWWSSVLRFCASIVHVNAIGDAVITCEHFVASVSALRHWSRSCAPSAGVGALWSAHRAAQHMFSLVQRHSSDEGQRQRLWEVMGQWGSVMHHVPKEEPLRAPSHRLRSRNAFIDAHVGTGDTYADLEEWIVCKPNRSYSSTTSM